jgi:hypothetical protein
LWVDLSARDTKAVNMLADLLSSEGDKGREEARRIRADLKETRALQVGCHIGMRGVEETGGPD